MVINDVVVAPFLQNTASTVHLLHNYTCKYKIITSWS